MKHNFLKKIQNKRVTIPICLILSIRIFIPMIYNYMKQLEKCFNQNYNLTCVNNIIDCIKLMMTNKMIAFIYVIIALILIFMIYNIYFTRKQLKVEKRELISNKKMEHTEQLILLHQKK